MSVKAYVLVNVELGKVSETLEAIRKIVGVKEAHAVAGAYDIVVQVEVESLGKLFDTVTRSIHNIGGVKSTLTLIVAE